MSNDNELIDVKIALARHEENVKNVEKNIKSFENSLSIVFSKLEHLPDKIGESMEKSFASFEQQQRNTVMQKIEVMGKELDTQRERTHELGNRLQKVELTKVKIVSILTFLSFCGAAIGWILSVIIDFYKV